MGGEWSADGILSLPALLELGHSAWISSAGCRGRQGQSATEGMRVQDAKTLTVSLPRCTVSSAWGETWLACGGCEPLLLEEEERWDGRPSPPPGGTQGGAPSSPSYLRAAGEGSGKGDGASRWQHGDYGLCGWQPREAEASGESRVRGWGVERKPLLKLVRGLLGLG